MIQKIMFFRPINFKIILIFHHYHLIVFYLKNQHFMVIFLCIFIIFHHKCIEVIKNYVFNKQLGSIKICHIFLIVFN